MVNSANPPSPGRQLSGHARIVADELYASSNGYPADDIATITAAAELAARAHHGQHRKSGEPYIFHPAAVAVLARSVGLGPEEVAAAWLHDTIEDTPVTIDDITEQFGERISTLVERLTKLDGIRLDTGADDDMRRLLLSLGDDPNVIIVKICDRLHNMRTIEALPTGKQQRIATETQAVYAPLARRMGLSRISAELEDRCFAILEPDEHRHVEQQVNADASERDRILLTFITSLREQFTEAGIDATFEHRSKHLWAVASKSRRVGIPVTQLHDLLGARVIVPTEADCYRAVGLVHAVARPVPGSFKDYIAAPKFNFYQSLHTVVVAPGGRRVEVQIRSAAMHNHANSGAAAHWRYKTSGTPWADSLLEGLVSPQRGPSDDIGVELNGGEILVFTPKGEMLRFPTGACPIDVAYAVHSDLGDSASTAVVNGIEAPLTKPLNHGDRVEIRTADSVNVDPVWLDVAVTSRAKANIRNALRRHRADTISEGHTLLTQWTGDHQIDIDQLASDLHFNTADDLAAAIGERRVTERHIRKTLGLRWHWSLTGQLDIEAKDRPRLLSAVVAAISAAGADIHESRTKVSGSRSHQRFHIRGDDEGVLTSAKESVRDVPGVINVTLHTGLRATG